MWKVRPLWILSLPFFLLVFAASSNVASEENLSKKMDETSVFEYMQRLRKNNRSSVIYAHEEILKVVPVGSKLRSVKEMLERDGFELHDLDKPELDRINRTLETNFDVMTIASRLVDKPWDPFHDEYRVVLYSKDGYVEKLEALIFYQAL